ncbi:hypothetical protein [Streptomyces sp. NBC_00239]|uniref:hypothetical protein n=1 Tax=Streptomyces sp. NBC_00239 TaxID=2903640 RepID=UPI002E2E2768|nr:hypothetical protein [Streptomyces sp. NBC_00239]
MEAELNRLMAKMRTTHRQVGNLQRDLRAAERQRDRDVADVNAYAQARKEARGTASMRALARELGVTHPAISAMVERAAKNSYSLINQSPLVPILSAQQATDYVKSGAFGYVTGAMVAMSEADILMESGRHPRAFADGTRISPPNLLLRNGEGELLGVEECLAGYGGTGPSNTVRLLTDLGWSEDVAREAFRYLYVEFDIERGVLRGSEQSLYHCGGNLEIVGERLVARLRAALPHASPSRNARDPLGLRAWTDEILDRPQDHPWAAGPRVARVYLNRNAAAGLQDRRYQPGQRNTPVSVVIEQGELQLWCSALNPSDWTELLSREQLDVLAAVDIYPADAEQRSWLDSFLPRRRERPDYIDISADGTHTLQYEPHGVERDSVTTEES